MVAGSATRRAGGDDEWRRKRDEEKFERVLALAGRLPELRAQVAADLHGPARSRAQVLATGARLLDLGAFRVGGEEYAEEHETFGLATLERRHVRLEGGRLVFDYPAKSGRRRRISIDDPQLVPILDRFEAGRTIRQALEATGAVAGDQLPPEREGGAALAAREAVEAAVIELLAGAAARGGRPVARAI